ncbi:hypothetical protein BDR04DRAFT_1118143 [Suillus decipiens]|nr:hypothetical protein BDR04DRAFT_1118143 [Suillus decipiens]
MPLFPNNPKKCQAYTSTPDIPTDLKQSGAGKTYAEFQEDPKMKPLIITKLKKFPWWAELHGWWQTNPAFNHAFSTADAGQDFASAALEHFNISKPLATGDDDAHADDDPEDGEIVEINSGTMDDDMMDDMIVDQPSCKLRLIVALWMMI